jgi:phosphatidylglycerophosphatase A
MMMRPWRVMAFGFGSGLSNMAPGTVGTLWAWAVALLFQKFLGRWSDLDIWVLLISGFLIGIWACGNSGEDLGTPDHSGMVWDEILAFWLILFFLLPGTWQVQCLAFIIFRFFYIVKPGPIAWVDQWFKHWQPIGFFGKWPSTIRGFGVMIDDLLAAFATLFILSFLKQLGFY